MSHRDKKIKPTINIQRRSSEIPKISKELKIKKIDAERFLKEVREKTVVGPTKLVNSSISLAKTVLAKSKRDYYQDKHE